MDTDGILLLFDEQRPCWTKSMTDLAGQDGKGLDVLAGEGLLENQGGVYSLTPEGALRFAQVAEESWLPLRAGATDLPQAERLREAEGSLLQMLLDKKHVQRWGLKEYCKPFRFEVPDLKNGDLFTFDQGALKWCYPEQNVFTDMEKDFPVVGLAARRETAPSLERLEAWKAVHMPRIRTMEIDLLYKSRYDFQAYTQFERLPGDPCDLLNTDRFLCCFAPPPLPGNRNDFLIKLGEFHMFLTMMRRMYMPGYVDLDSLDQDGINWLIYVYPREEDALKCLELLSPLGQALAGPAAPLEVWTLSLEALEDWKETVESIHDLLPYAAHPILRIV